MEIIRGYKKIFTENGFDSFDKFMDFSGGEVLKKITLRSITKFYLTSDGKKTGFYLKRHSYKPRLASKVKGLLKKNNPSEAKLEFDATLALTKAKVPCAKAVAFGERASSGTLDSFLITEALDAYTQLEKMIFDFAPPLSREILKRKRALIQGVAELSARLHNAGFNHKDLYLTHILAKFDKAGGYDLKLIDLQRVEHRTTGRRRWLVKDISALNYSSPVEIITRTDKLRFYKAYVNRVKLNKDDRAFIKSVLAKTERVAAHTIKMYKRREERVNKGLLER